MQDINFLQIFFNLLPALIIGLISFYFYSSYLTNENNRRIYELKRESAKSAMPQRLQAL